MNELADLYAVDLSDFPWRKSPHTASNGNCVEITDIPAPDGVAVRDSKNVDIPAARVSRRAWFEFVGAVDRETLV
ncbi:DUF397 domain-containing protein [Streptomyces sp. UNOC14_S4]|uniref:DUF397 domain-containing protein n=1 Tax=Streptomyces sp. UNOC14_S4 TaxID=2872340 RepID=UPI001E546370|nr:DUF397 domain-containing protein [Streptomyces sp. UNOC14_S4]MCC3771164.1 DUF397 domain-containing protein [Streptomyces sp. UNOC14_S4]